MSDYKAKKAMLFCFLLSSACCWSQAEPKSAAEIIAEAERLSAQLISATGSVSLPEESPDNNIDAGNNVATDTLLPDESDSADFTDSDNLSEDVLTDTDVASGAVIKLFEKMPALEPLLMVKGSPVDEIVDHDAISRISGRLIPEKQMIDRRRHYFRWVLETPAGLRIPLKSNLKLLQEIKKEQLLDGYVTLSGKYTDSGFSRELKYFVVESIVMLDKLPEPEKKAEPGLD